MKKIFIACFVTLTISCFAQRKPMESSLVLGYQKYFPSDPLGLANIGYTAFFEHESLTHFTRRSRFTASALLNPLRDIYGLQVGGSYTYVAAFGFQANVLRKLPLSDRTWRANLNPFVGIDIWFLSFHVGYNIQLSLQPPLVPQPPPIGRLNFTINAYIPLKRNKRMYQ